MNVVRGAGVTALELAGNAVRIAIGEKVLQAKNAALASGKHNLRGWPRRPDATMAYKIQLELSPHAARDLDGVVQLASYRGGYIGACNVEEGMAPICWLLDASAVQKIGADGRRSSPGSRSSRNPSGICCKAPASCRIDRGDHRHPLWIHALFSRCAQRVSARRPALRHSIVHRRWHFAGAVVRRRGGSGCHRGTDGRSLSALVRASRARSVLLGQGG